MQKINLLPSEIYNKISAGEVVERPASIVKELVENSIDAGSDNIVIDIVDGGITSIIVSDNGSGISKNYIKLAFMPHATSKISSDKDLENIATLGFRGEALPSIASISSVEIKTKSIDENTGIKYQIKGGIENEISEIDCNSGTTIEVRNIFFNTPARQKFLKKPKAEEHEITSVVQGLILANPNVAIKYSADGKVIFNSNGKGLENAIYSIYPTSITKELIFIHDEKNDIIVKGYIGLPSLSKANRNYQTTIVNGRLITNTTISTAVSQAYGNMLMKRSFPVFCLEIIMPFNMLDVNVTPSKTDVRFADNRAVFSSVYHAVLNGLDKNKNYFTVSENHELQFDSKDNINDISIPKEESPSAVEKNISSDMFKHYENDDKSIENNFLQNPNQQVDNIVQNKKNTELDNNLNNIFEKTEISSKSYEYTSKNQPNLEENGKINSLLQQFKEIKSDKKFSMPNNSSILKANDTTYSNVNFNKNITQSTMFDEIEEEFSLSNKIVGQLFNTYLIVAKGETAYIIDQHATHERLIYDKLVEQIETRNIATQPLLSPQIIELSAIDSGIIGDMLEDIRKIGFDIEEFGQYTFKINSIPIVFPSFNANKFINMLLEDKNALSTIKLENVLHDELAKRACKSAIKAGQKLNEAEIQKLIEMIEENKPTQCPHGRPTIIKFSRKDIDKLFKRIL